MNVINLKYLEIFTDGSSSFSYKSFKDFRQVVFYDKDTHNFLLYRKPTKSQPSRNLSKTIYKSKYKF